MTTGQDDRNQAKKNVTTLAAIVGCVLVIGIPFYMHFHPPVYTKSFDTCYFEKPEGVRSLKYTEPDVYMNRPPLKISGEKPEGFETLPEMEGYSRIPPLRVAVLEQWRRGSPELLDALRQLQTVPLEKLFLPETQENLRKILFLWGNVAGIDPNSRGPFIDGREIAYVEAVMNQRFLQMNAYPNPAPVAASSMRQAFNLMFNRNYAVLLEWNAGRSLFVPRSQGPAAPPFTHQAISPEALSRIVEFSLQLPTSEQKEAYWTNVLRMVEGAQEPDLKFIVYNRRLLDTAIHQSLPDLDIDPIRARLKEKKVLDDSTVWTDKDGAPVDFQVFYISDQNMRRICYSKFKKMTSTIERCTVMGCE